MKQQINLYQGSLRRERPAFSALTMSGGLALCLLGLTIAWFLATGHGDRLDRERLAIQRQEAAAAQRLEKLTRTLASYRTDDGDTQTLRDTLAALARRERLLKLIDGPALGETSGFSDPMRALAQHSLDGLWLTRILVTAPNMRTTLEGRATFPSLVPEYLLGLSAEGVLSGQRFDRFAIEQSTDPDDGTVRFSMTSVMAERFALRSVTP